MTPRSTALLVPVALAAAFASSPAPAAAPDPVAFGPLDSQARVAPQPPATGPGTPHKPLGVFTNFGTPTLISLEAGAFTPLASQSIKCTKSAGCTLTFHLQAQIGPPPNTNWALCVMVDALVANPGCPYLGTSPTVGSYVGGSALSSITVAAGTHTVTPQIYVSNTTTLGAWSSEIGVYTP